MARRLPPLHQLHIFDAAGRHQSFKHAAEELHITPSAVSHQIKALEANLGFALFRRGNRKLELTEAGAYYLTVVDKAFTRLRQGTEHVIRDHGSRTLHISVLPSFGQYYLMPQLNALQERLPAVNLRIETSEKIADIALHHDVDLAVRYGLGDWPGLVSEELFDVECSPVCSPTLAQTENIARLEDIVAQPLIHMSFYPHAWSLWSRVAGLPEFEPAKELWFDSYEACLQASEQGLGLALGLFPLEKARLDSGRLAAPLDVRVPLPQKIYMVYRPEDGARVEMKVLREWMQEEAERVMAA